MFSLIWREEFIGLGNIGRNKLIKVKIVNIGLI